MNISPSLTSSCLAIACLLAGASPLVAQEPAPPQATSPAGSTPEPSAPPVPAADQTPAPGSRYQALNTTAAQQALQLTESQTSQIAAAFSELDAALLSVPADQRPQLIEKTDQQIASILDASQRAAFDRLFPEKRLKFNFRYEKWSNVLQWIADEADLSLVMDAPPPGTFNYTDSRDYSPSAAIDLLNGWLLTKGYTLIRRDRLLMVLDLNQGIPAGTIPQVPLERLALHGDFEFVTVLFPLGGRPPESVATEISPFLSSSGKSENLAQTGQVMVTDVAGNLRKIEKIIETIPVPKAAPKPPEKPQPKPILKTYALQHANAEKVGEVVKQFISGTVFVDPVASQISVNAIESDQSRVQQIIDQLEANQGPEQQPLMELYPVRPENETELLATLRLIAPNGQYRVDTLSRKLLAWASPAEHLKIAEVLKKLDAESGDRVPAQLQVYSISELDGDALRSLLTELLPTARSTLDSRSGSLAVIGTITDHLAVQSLIEQLRSREPALKRTLETYPTEGVDRSRVVEVLEQIVPGARVVSGGTEDQLIVLATETDQQLVKDSLGRLMATVEPGEEKVVQAYELREGVTLETVSSLLASLVPQAQVSSAGPADRIVVIASQRDHAVIAQALETLGPDEKDGLPELRFYASRPEVLSETVSILQALAPRAQITTDADSGRISVVAVDRDHTIVSDTLQKLDAVRAPGEAFKLVIYPVTSTQKSRFQSISESLASTLNGMRVLADAQPRELAVWATPGQHGIVSQILQQLQQSLPPDRQPVLVSYPVLKLEAESIVESLQEFFPDTEMKVDGRANRILIWASPSEHETFRKTIEQLDTDIPEAIEIRLMAYPLKGVDLSVATQILQQELPELVVVADSTSRSLIIRGRLSEHQRVGEILETLQQQTAAAADRSAVVYPYEGSDPTAVRELLLQAHPDARIVNDVRNRRILVWATSGDQARIRQTLTEMGRQDSGQAVLQSYALGGRDYRAVLQMLAQVVPEAYVAMSSKQNRLLSWATPTQQEQVRAIVEGIGGGDQAVSSRQMKIFDIERVGSTTALKVLAAAVPDVELIESPDGKRLIGWMEQDQAELIESTLKTVATATGADNNRQLRVYELKQLDDSTALSMLRTAVPDVSFSRIGDGRSLVAWTLEQEHQQIQQTLTELESAAADRAEPVIVTHSIRDLGAQVPQAITSAVPGAVVIPGADPSQVIIKALPDEQTEVEQLLEMLKATKSRPAAKQLFVFEVRGTSPEAVLQVLRPLADADIQFTVDPDGNRLFVRARAEQHEAVKAMVDTITGSLPSRADLATRVYAFQNPDADEVQSALRQLLPEAGLVVDSDRKLLVATATESEHELIRRIVDDVVSATTGNSGLTAKVYSTGNISPRQVENALEDVFSRRECQLSADSERGVLLAVGSARVHQQIEQFLKELQSMASEAPKRTLQFYSTEELDGQAVEEVVERLLDRMDRDASVVLDERGNQLVVEASAEAQAAVAATMSQMSEVEPREVEVFQLSVTDAFTAELAVMNLFDSLSGESATAPMVSGDTETQQLLVRGTRGQIDQIRDLLVKMGELSLGNTAAPTQRGNLRQIPLNQDSDQLLRQIEQLWPQLRKNPIRIMQPGSRLERLLPAGSSSNRNPQPDDTQAQFSVDDPLQVPGSKAPPAEVTTTPTDGPHADAPQPVATQSDATHSGESQPGMRSSSSVAAGQRKAPGEAEPRRDPEADVPIVIIPGDNRLTIASEDTEALDQFEQLLRLLRQQGGRTSNRDFTVYALHNAAATDVANTLRELYEDRRNVGRLSTGSVLIVPEQRLNAVIVYANRIDRSRIEPLIETLDSTNAPDALTAYETQVLPIRHAEARGIEDVLSGIYKAEMTAGGARQSVSIPKGVPAEVASVLRQINASASSPLLTIEVEAGTNSLVIKAPRNLLSDVVALAQQLDDAVATSDNRSVRILPLQKVNSARMLKTLNQVLD